MQQAIFSADKLALSGVEGRVRAAPLSFPLQKTQNMYDHGIMTIVILHSPGPKRLKT